MRQAGVNMAENANSASGGVFRSLAMCFERTRVGELLVHRGYISSDELNLALAQQHRTGKPLGYILTECAMISRRQLILILAWQKSVRTMAAFVLCLVSLTGMAKKAKADITDIPAGITLAMAATAEVHTYASLRQHPRLFGADEKFSPSLKAFTKWTGMFERFNNDMKSEQSRKVMDGVLQEIAQYKSASIAKMAENVNDMMNRQKYVLDSKNWGKSDYWATPVEFMLRGGDCEDFAIAKYTALRLLGVPENRLRIAIVHDQKKNIPHAVLVVYSEKGPLILDNQIKEARVADTIGHYKPIFSINRDGWWLHTTPQGNESTMIASAK